jgi:hypothetical protein
MFFFITASKMVLDEQPTGFKNGGFLKTSHFISVDLPIFDTP